MDINKESTKKKTQRPGKKTKKKKWFGVLKKKSCASEFGQTVTRSVSDVYIKCIVKTNYFSYILWKSKAIIKAKN